MPRTGVAYLARKRFEALDTWNILLGEEAEAGHQILCREPCAAFRYDVPALGNFVEVRMGDGRVELNAAPQIEAIGNTLQVPQDFPLVDVARAPFPLPSQIRVERI